jgi:hypothetical protein
MNYSPNDLSIVQEVQRRYTILVERCARLERENSRLKDIIAADCPDGDNGINDLS